MKLSIYMKSGNVIRIRNVKDYEFKMNGNSVSSLKIETHGRIFGGPRLLVQTIDLSQIEAVTRGPWK